MRTPESLLTAVAETQVWLGKVDSEVELTIREDEAWNWWNVSAFCSLCRKREDDFCGFADSYFAYGTFAAPKETIVRSLYASMRECVEGRCVPAQTAAEAIEEACLDLARQGKRGESETFDGLTAAECLDAYQRNIRACDGPELAPLELLTDLQIDTARREWSAALRARVEEQKAKEREQVVCDDDRWEVE